MRHVSEARVAVADDAKPVDDRIFVHEHQQVHQQEQVLLHSDQEQVALGREPAEVVELAHAAAETGTERVEPEVHPGEAEAPERGGGPWVAAVADS